MVLAATMAAGGCSSASEETTVTSEATTEVTTTVSEETSEETTTTEFPIDPSWYRWDVFLAPRSLPQGELFERDLPLPEGIDVAYSCSVSEGTVVTDETFGGYYSVDFGDHAVSCDYEFFFYDRELTDEEVEAYEDMLDGLDYGCAQTYNGMDYHAYTVDGIFMALKNYNPTDEYPDGRAWIVFASSQGIYEYGFIGVG